ncbi:MAG: hypothetical protein GY862_37535 [Gammaproteobacteria bacterium]|nr:hypothetical protein [Gammaproteobacteria bacterium]
MTSEIKQKLMDLLLECPSMQQQDSRNALIRELSFAAAVDANSNPKVHILSLVNACLIHDNGLASLLEALDLFDGKTEPFQRLTEFVSQSIYPVKSSAAHSGENEKPRNANEEAAMERTSETFSMSDAVQCADSYSLDIHRQNRGYFGILRYPGGRSVHLGELALGPDAEVAIKGRRFTLEALTRILSDSKDKPLQQAFDEPGQLEIGRYLYRQVFEKIFGEHPPSAALRIQTHDEEIVRLPWALLAVGARFLVNDGWTVALTGGTPCPCLLPAAPRMLAIMPRLSGNIETEAHLLELKKQLFRFMPRPENCLRTAETWEDFVRLTGEFKPQLLYYYGRSEAAGTRLLFAAGSERKSVSRSATDFARVLRENRPDLVYINCCQEDDAGGLSEFGRQLEADIPAVAVNRGPDDAARRQAMRFWEEVITRGEPPNRAVAGLYREVLGTNLDSANASWLTPVLHAHYSEWRATGRKFTDTPRDAYWTLKIDRVSQFAEVSYLTGLMLKEEKPRCRAFVWYGCRGDGVELFHERLEKELREGAAAFYPVAPEWPEVLGDSTDDAFWSFQDMLQEAFDVDQVKDIPFAIRTRTRGVRQVLVYVRHPSIKSVGRVINPRTLKTYLQCWDKFVLPELEPGQFILSTVSFVVNKPGAFETAMEGQGLADENFKHTVFRLLDRMDVLARRDLREFLHSHDAGVPDNLPNAKLNELLDDILARTDGRYEQTVEELKKLSDLLPAKWGDRRASPAADKENEFDY